MSEQEDELLEETLKANGIDLDIGVNSELQEIVETKVLELIQLMSYNRGSCYRSLFFAEGEDDLDSAMYYLESLVENEEEPDWQPSLQAIDIHTIVFSYLLSRQQIIRAHCLRYLFINQIEFCAENIYEISLTKRHSELDEEEENIEED